MTDLAQFKVTFDDGRTEITTFPQIMQWRRWSDREYNKILDVSCGVAKIFCTSRNGEACDIERVG